MSNPVITRFHDADMTAEIILNNGRQSNALTPELLAELPKALDSVIERNARAVVVHAVGVSKNFCAGLSIDSLSQSAQPEFGCQVVLDRSRPVAPAPLLVYSLARLLADARDL